MLGRIQRRLATLYDLPLGPNVEDFICSEDTVRTALGENATARGELLLVLDDGAEVHVGLYIDPAALSALEARHAPTQRDEAGLSAVADAKSFGAMCLATEGVSHFVYLSFRADFDESVSQLELELQAEVDKYASALPTHETRSRVRRESRALRARLFGAVTFLDAAHTVEGARYRTVHRLAARYARWLEGTFIERGKLGSLEVELRRFYRMGMRDKLEHIRRRPGPPR